MATRMTIEEGGLHPLYKGLYGTGCDEPQMDKRFLDLVERHRKLFGNTSVQLYSTSGRSELAGNHTDHNKGKVIAAGIDLDTIAAVSPRSDRAIILDSENYPPLRIELDDLNVRSEEEGKTEALVRGIAKAFSDRNLTIGGWQANTSSRVLKGSGLSSSATVEVLCATIFNHLFNNDCLPPEELAKIGQYAENTYFGKPSGLEDQMGCACGGIIGIDFADSGNPVVTPISFSFADHGQALTIIDTGGNHADLTDEYAAIPREMRTVAAWFGKHDLREVPKSDFYANLKRLRDELANDRALLRAMHFFAENERVTIMQHALQNDDLPRFFENVRASGESSFCFLQNLYASFYPQQQGLSLALSLCKELLGPSATARVHGGGFAGTVQAYVPISELERFKQGMEAVFGPSSVTVLTIRNRPTCCIAD